MSYSAFTPSPTPRSSFDTPGIHQRSTNWANTHGNGCRKNHPQQRCCALVGGCWCQAHRQKISTLPTVQNLHKKRPIKQLVLGLNKSDQQRPRHSRITAKSIQVAGMVGEKPKVLNRQSKVRRLPPSAVLAPELARDSRIAGDPAHACRWDLAITKTSDRSASALLPKR